MARFKTEESKISKPCQISGRSACVRIDWTLYSGPRLADGSVEHGGGGGAGGGGCLVSTL